MKISERGPWTVAENGRMVNIRSGDFTHDVILIVTGDFAEPADKIRYAQRLADLLNEAFEFAEE